MEMINMLCQLSVLDLRHKKSLFFTFLSLSLLLQFILLMMLLRNLNLKAEL